MGVLYIACFTLLLALCTAEPYRSDDMLQQIEDHYEDYVERKEEMKTLNDLEKRAEVLEWAVDKDRNGNRDTCDAVDVKCHHCMQCWPGGWCVNGKST